MNFSKKKLQEICDYWNLGNIRNSSKLYGGLQTPKTLVETTEGKFVISRHTLSSRKALINKSPLSLRYELELLHSLRDIPVPNFLASKDGNYLEKIENEWITVDVFFEGEHLKTLTTLMVRQLGEFLGNFHTQGRSFTRVLRERRRFYDLNARALTKMSPVVRKQSNSILKTVIEEVRSGVEYFRPPANLPTGPVHVDIKPDNELWADGKLVAVLDFGNFYIDTLMIDVGKTIMWNCVKGPRLDESLVKAFLSGYESKRKLSKREREYVTGSICFAIYSHIWVDLFHVPLGYVPESYTKSLVKEFLPIARSLTQTVLPR